MSSLIGPDTTFNRMGSVHANRAGYYIYFDGMCPSYLGLIIHLLVWKGSLPLEPDTRFIRKGSIPGFCCKNKNDQPASRAAVDQFLLTQPRSAGRFIPVPQSGLSGPVELPGGTRRKVCNREQGILIENISYII